MHVLSTVFKLDWLPNKRFQACFLIVFIFINIALFLFAAAEEVETADGKRYLLHPAYSQASDGQRYWGTALSLAKTGQFLMRSELEIHSDNKSLQPLSRAGPIPAILFALPMKIFGFNNAVFFIIAGQCFLLWVMSLCARGIAEPFGANKTLSQGLVLFNPNLIGVAHHAQSDLIFALVFTLLVLVISRVIQKPGNFGLVGAIVIAILAGLLPLARPIGAYCVALLPLFLLIALLIRHQLVRVDWAKFLRLGVISAILTLAILTPWSVRNYLVFDTVGLTQSGAIQARYYYRALKTYGLPDSTPAVKQYLAQHGHEPSCLNSGEPGSGCEEAIRNAYMSLIFSAPKTILIKVQSLAILKTLLSGGTRTITDYIGLHPPEDLYSSLRSLNWGDLNRAIMGAYKYNPIYLLLFLAMTSFPFFTRGLGLVGLIRATFNPRCHGHVAFYILMVGLLLVLYGFHGWSRFRVPIEPVLMVFSAIALTKSIPRKPSQPHIASF